MTTPEGKVKKEICKYLDSLGPDCWFFKPMIMGYGRKGIPDIIGCYKGKFFAIEAKAPGKENNTTAWQDEVLLSILNANGYACVVSNVECLRAIFPKI